MPNHSREDAENATNAVVGALIGIGTKMYQNYKHNSEIESQQKKLENEYLGFGSIFNSGEIEKLEDQKKSWWSLT